MRVKARKGTGKEPGTEPGKKPEAVTGMAERKGSGMGNGSGTGKGAGKETRGGTGTGTGKERATGTGKDDGTSLEKKTGTGKSMRARKPKGRSILEKIKDVQIEVQLPRTITSIRPLARTVPGFSTETTEIGVAEICKNKALYLRLSLRSDH